jgi:hypothetical protein
LTASVARSDKDFRFDWKVISYLNWRKSYDCLTQYVTVNIEFIRLVLLFAILLS